MKFFSEVTKNLYDTQEDLIAAEAAEEKRKSEAEDAKKIRAARAKEVEEAYRAANDLLNEFIKDYGTYHTSLSGNFSGKSLFDRMFDIL